MKYTLLGRRTIKICGGAAAYDGPNYWESGDWVQLFTSTSPVLYIKIRSDFYKIKFYKLSKIKQDQKPAWVIERGPASKKYNVLNGVIEKKEDLMGPPSGWLDPRH